MTLRVHSAPLLRRTIALCSALACLGAGAAAAPFTAARAIDGSPISTTGQVTVVNYWATWCAPCRAEMPALDAVFRRHRDEGLVMVAVSIETGVTVARLHTATQPFSFRVARLADVKMTRRDIPAAVPLTRVYDKAGRLRFQSRADGRSIMTQAQLEGVVAPLLAER